MANNAAKEALFELEQRRLLAKEVYENRLIEVYKRVPKLEEIRTSIKISSIQIAKVIINGGEEYQKLIDEIKENTQTLRDQERYLLTSVGYPADYLQNIYKCNICNDTGFVENKKCKCYRKLVIEKLYQISNLKNVIELENFETFNINYFSYETVIDGITPRQSITLNFKIAQSFVEKFDTEYRNLYMYGQVGRGKTFLCNCIAKELLDLGHVVIYVSAIDLFNKLNDYKFNRNENLQLEQFIEYLQTADLLIIDDLGTEFQTQFTSSELFNIINKRHTDRKHTIISSNLGFQEIQQIYSKRIESRLIGDFDNLKFVGDDIRRLKKFS